IEDRLPCYKKSLEAYPDNPDREKYPLYGFSNHDLYHGQTLWAHNEWLDAFRTIDGKPFCRIHEDTAAERGIKTGDTVRIFNDHGTCVLKALVTKGIQKESVWVPHGFVWDEFEEGFAQSLTAYCPDPVTSNANFNDWICQVEKI
ncbi:MAG: molybdopterin dinucleotide binding domain-containing protein, partial [Raoultibacter sp.]